MSSCSAEIEFLSVMNETETSQHLLSCNNTTENAEILGTSLDDGKKEDSSLAIRKMILLIAYPILIIFGTFGNSLVFVVMRRGSLKHVSTCFYMSILALADTGKTWTFQTKPF